jgi:hypothetical protein
MSTLDVYAYPYAGTRGQALPQRRVATAITWRFSATDCLEWCLEDSTAWCLNSLFCKYPYTVLDLHDEQIVIPLTSAPITTFIYICKVDPAYSPWFSIGQVD